MPDQRSHRGAHPEDVELFAAAHRPALQTASAELHWLLDRGYALRSALALTGDRHGLTQRQRLAVARCACTATQHARRTAHRQESSAVAGAELWIDGYNLLITVESALAGGVILLGRDECYRDMASLHGTYREVAETERAAALIGTWAADFAPAKCLWLIDRPVGNSGRLKTTLLSLAAQHGWRWDVRLEFSPDRLLAATDQLVATADSVVLDRCARWCNAARAIVDRHCPDATVIDLSRAAAA
jgi:hypothetical protein